MPRGDGTGPDGKGPKRKNKGWPRRFELELRRRRKGHDDSQQNDQPDKKE